MLSTHLFAAGKIDPSFVISHVFPLEKAAYGYEIFEEKRENCIKVVLKPQLKAWEELRTIDHAACNVNAHF